MGDGLRTIDSDWTHESSGRCSPGGLAEGAGPGMGIGRFATIDIYQKTGVSNSTRVGA